MKNHTEHPSQDLSQEVNSWKDKLE